jgi:hypothetical protein
MAATLARFRNVKCTQGSADAFVQATEYTGIDPSGGKGWMLTRLEVAIPVLPGIQALSADAEMHWSVSRDSKTAVVSLDDADSIAMGGFFNSLTTSGQVLVPALFVHEFAPGIIVVEPTIFFQLDSTATGLANVNDFRLYYEEVKLSEVDILRMLTQG